MPSRYKTFTRRGSVTPGLKYSLQVMKEQLRILRRDFRDDSFNDMRDYLLNRDPVLHWRGAISGNRKIVFTRLK